MFGYYLSVDGGVAASADVDGALDTSDVVALLVWIFDAVVLVGVAVDNCDRDLFRRYVRLLLIFDVEFLLQQSRKICIRCAIS